jgi:hypothetical protein
MEGAKVRWANFSLLLNFTNGRNLRFNTFMKSRNLLLPLLLTIGAGCAPSTSSPSATTSFTNADAPYTANVSGIYELASYGTVGSWTNIDIKWKNSKGIIQAMSAYGDSGKPVLLSFWATTNATDASEIPALDSVQNVLGDSVGIVTIGENNTFQAFYNYDTLNKIKVQIVVDSAGLTNIQYAGLADGKIGWPETFVLKPNGSIMAYGGYQSERALDSLVRAAYH